MEDARHTPSVSAALVPVLTRDQMREVDRLMVDEYGIALLQMMENAGRNLAELADRLLGGVRGRTICAIAGTGNNGGGALAAARHAANRGADVAVVLARDRREYQAAAGRQVHTLRRMGLSPAAFDGTLPPADMYLDGIVGYSLSGALRGPERELARALNASGTPALSLDTPTGVDVDTGASGEAAVRATATMTLALPKVGLLSDAARPLVGDLYLADISVPPGLYGHLGLSAGPIFAADSIVLLDRRG